MKLGSRLCAVLTTFVLLASLCPPMLCRPTKVRAATMSSRS